MPKFSFSILYVANPPASAAFYADLLGVPVAEQSPTFAMLPLGPDVMLGLWKRDGVEPAVTAQPGGGETAFAVDSPEAVESLWREWKEKGVAIVQDPVRMDFGTTFTGLDPDGHRLRVLSPQE